MKYDWGKPASTSKVASLTPNLTHTPTTPTAELWMGTHPNAPSKTGGKLLSNLLDSNPQLLGSTPAPNGQLPFLFKVLSINKALSIQAHPDKALAEKLHRERPDVYKDENHKPEMAIALTPFEALAGFKPIEEIRETLRTFPELASLIDAAIITSQVSDKEWLKSILTSLLNASTAAIEIALASTLSRLSGKTYGVGSMQELFLRLDTQFPGPDIGKFCAFLLNYIKLTPGQAFFMPANDPHAYLSGDCIECMATSDNVVRVGLTPKLKDVPTLLGMLTYNSGPPSLLTPQKVGEHSRLFVPPTPEFNLMDSTISKGQTVEFPGAGPGIILVYEGSGVVYEGEREFSVGLGDIWFVGNGVGLKVEGNGVEGVKFCRAFCT